MLITEIEDAIVARLKSTIPDRLVDSFPDKPSEFRLLHPKGAMLVRFRGSKYGEPQTTGTVLQERTVEFDIVIVTRNLRDHSGAYIHLDAVRVALTGYKIPNSPCSKFYPVREEFIDESEGIWQYGITVATSLFNTELQDSSVLTVLLTNQDVNQY